MKISSPHKNNFLNIHVQQHYVLVKEVIFAFWSWCLRWSPLQSSCTLWYRRCNVRWNFWSISRVSTAWSSLRIYNALEEKINRIEKPF